MPGNERRARVLALAALCVVDYAIAFMKLITAHKILICSATIFFLFFALWEWRNYTNSNDYWAMWRSLLYFVVAVGFGIYLKNLRRWYK